MLVVTMYWSNAIIISYSFITITSNFSCLILHMRQRQYEQNTNTTTLTGRKPTSGIIRRPGPLRLPVVVPWVISTITIPEDWFRYSFPFLFREEEKTENYDKRRASTNVVLEQTSVIESWKSLTWQAEKIMLVSSPKGLTRSSSVQNPDSSVERK